MSSLGKGVAGDWGGGRGRGREGGRGVERRVLDMLRLFALA